TGAERQPDAQTGGDQRGGELQRLGEGTDADGEGVRVEVVDRTAEQGGVGAADRAADGCEGVAGALEEVSERGLDVLIGRGDHDRPDDGGGDDGEQRDRRVAGDHAVDRIAPSGGRWHVRAELGRLRLGGGHACTPSIGWSALTPAIMSPSFSRGVSPGTIPTTRPRYITRMRSARAATSSSSVEITITGTPASRVSTIRLWMNSMDPTSTPRVGWAAMNSDRSRLSSRASTTFCWLPP